MRPSWFLYLYSFRNESRKKKAYVITRSIFIAQKVWDNITPAYLQSLYESMPRRMQAVVDAQGGHTKY